MADHPMPMFTLGIVATYHRPELLRRCLEALLAQRLDASQRLEVLVVDNACTDSTPELLEQWLRQEPRLHVLRLSCNGGGAGGFHHGLRWAFSRAERLPDDLWLLDDDTIAEPEALQQLLRCRQAFLVQNPHQPAFVCSRVLWRDGSICEMNIPTPVWDWTRFHAQPPGLGPSLVDSCSFVSVLISREKVEQAGLPIEDFFIWCDDQEYTRRLTKLGYPGLYDPLSVVIHQTKENRGVNPCLMTESEVWKYCFGLRNNAYLHRRRGFHWLLYFLVCRGKDLLKAPVSWRSKCVMLAWLLHGAIVFHPRVVSRVVAGSSGSGDTAQRHAKPLMSQSP